MVGVRNLTSAPTILKDIRSSLTWSSPTPVPLDSTNSSPPRYLVTCLENNKRITGFLLQLCNLAPWTSPLAFGLHTSQGRGPGNDVSNCGPRPLAATEKKIELNNQVSVGHIRIKPKGILRAEFDAEILWTFRNAFTWNDNGKNSYQSVNGRDSMKLSFSTESLPYDKLFNICVHLIFGKSQISTRSFTWANRLKVKSHTS